METRQTFSMRIGKEPARNEVLPCIYLALNSTETEPVNFNKLLFYSSDSLPLI